MNYDVIPYVGVGPLRFGMTPEDVTRSSGPPLHNDRTRNNELKQRHPDFTLVFSDAVGLVEASFAPEAHLMVGGVDLFRHRAPLRHLAALDPSPLESVGILYFPKLGITLSGFHKEDSRTVTVMCGGRLDDLLPRFKPYTILRNVL